MRIPTFVALTAVAFIGSGSIAIGADPKSNPDSADTVRLRMVAQSWSWPGPAEKPVLLISLLNEGKKDLWLTRRLVDNAPESPAAFRELWFDVREVGGPPLQFSCSVRVGSAPLESYVRLERGQSIGGVVSLGFCYKFAKGRRYEIVPHWQDSGPASSNPPKGAVSAGHEITAPAVVIDY